MSTNQPLQMGIPSTMGDNVQLTLKYLFDRGPTVQPNVPIITKLDNGFHKIRFSEFRGPATKLASGLAQCGVGIGDIVATFCWNTVRHMMAYYAIPNMGAALLPLNVRLHPKELAYIIGHAQPKVIIIDEVNLPLFEKIPSTAFGSVRYFIICGKNMTSLKWNSTLPNTTDFDVLLSSGSNTYPWPNLDEKSGAFLFYTSGTTGNPKGVLYSHRAVSLTLFAMTRMAFEGEDCVLALPPMFHAGGWWVTFCAMTFGFKVLLPNDCYDFNALMDWSVNEGATCMFGVPTMILGLAQALKQNPTKFARFRGNLKFLTGGTAIPGHVVNWLWKEWKINIMHGWGMTEALPGTLSKRVYRRRDLLLTDEGRTKNVLKQGTFDPLVQSKLVNPDNPSIPMQKNGRDMGELLIRGPSVTSSYYKGVSPKSFLNGWLKTGDICKITPENEMQITDRTKDLIKSGGEWISSVDMENYIMQLPEIELACVVGVYHPKWDERPICVVKLYQNQKLTKQQVLDHVATKYAKFQIPDDVLFWDDIPLTGTGKMSKRTVRDMLTKDNYKLPTSFTASKL